MSAGPDNQQLRMLGEVHQTGHGPLGQQVAADLDAGVPLAHVRFGLVHQLPSRLQLVLGDVAALAAGVAIVVRLLGSRRSSPSDSSCVRRVARRQGPVVSRHGATGPQYVGMTKVRANQGQDSAHVRRSDAAQRPDPCGPRLGRAVVHPPWRVDGAYDAQRGAAQRSSPHSSPRPAAVGGDVCGRRVRRAGPGPWRSHGTGRRLRSRRTRGPRKTPAPARSRHAPGTGRPRRGTPSAQAPTVAVPHP